MENKEELNIKAIVKGFKIGKPIHFSNMIMTPFLQIMRKKYII